MSEGANPDREILNAIRPAMATIPNSKLIVISSPYARSGILYETHRDYYGKDNSSEILVWKAETRVMNPTISQELIDRESKKDPSASRAEWYAEFRDDIETFLSPETVAACAVIPGEMAPMPDVVYHAFCDPSGGRADAFTLEIGHQDYETRKLSVDLLRGWTPPFNPDDVVAEITEILSKYRMNRIAGDHYAANWVASAFDKNRINYVTCEKAKSDLYLSLEGYINTKRVEFQKDKSLIAELINLERRRGRSGKDIVDQPPRGSDDLANSLAGVCHVLTSLEGSLFAHCDLR